HDIIRILEAARPTWRKWEEPRETLLKTAAPCWIPIEDLRSYLNEMPGPTLTATDVAQRLRDYYEQPYATYPNEDLKSGCLSLYEKEKADGTELPAIIGALQEYVEQEEERIRTEQQTAWRKRVEDERNALEQRFMSGADCKWTPLQRSKELYCRMNGRIYRLSPTIDKMWNLHRIRSIDDDNGYLIGKYQHRRDVTKIMAQVAYQPEPNW
ncbi:MAG TPA: hypothetical protein VGC26_03870, partial [Afipia sp.]